MVLVFDVEQLGEDFTPNGFVEVSARDNSFRNFERLKSFVSTNLGNFSNFLISQTLNFLFTCMYSPNNITWIVPATQNKSVWYDQGRPSCISVHVNPSV